MEESNILKTVEYQQLIEKLEDDMQDLLNIVQLLEITLQDNEEDEHITRSVHVIHKMVKTIIDNDLTL